MPSMPRVMNKLLLPLVLALLVPVLASPSSARALENRIGGQKLASHVGVSAQSDVASESRWEKTRSRMDFTSGYLLAPEGGRYGKVRAANTGGEVHHMPADSVSPLSRSKGPGILMDKADHARTASHGSQGLAGAKYRARQKALIEQGRFDDAVQMDIDDIQSKSANKYDDAILEMIDSLD
jgi:hypothetical protein